MRTSRRKSRRSRGRYLNNVLNGVLLGTAIGVDTMALRVAAEDAPLLQFIQFRLPSHVVQLLIETYVWV